MDSRVEYRAHPAIRPVLRAMVALLAALPLAATATIELPDHVIYGNATVFGSPAAIGSVVEVRSVPQGALLASYALGRNPRLGGQFAVNIPMDAVEPRVAGRARPGDPVQIYLGGQLAGQTSVGAEGVAVRLDIDPQLLGTGPALSVADAQRIEGNAGQSTLSFAVTINADSANAVNVDWETVDGSAVGGIVCGPDVDYVQDFGTAAIAAHTESTTIAVLVCGDALIETDETFTIMLDGIQNAVLATAEATGTIMDDDNVPALQVPDARALEPTAGVAQLAFTARLTRAAPNDVLVNYSTQDASAIGNLDYVPAAGTLTIPAGELEATIAVALLADAPVEADEQFVLLLSNPAHATLARTQAVGTIVDPAFDPAVDNRGGPDASTVPELLQPTGIVVSPDGRHVYATSDQNDTLLAFARLAGGDGQLTFVDAYTDEDAGFESALLDGANGLVLSPDGKHVYVAARGSDAIAAFSRDSGSGALSFIGNVVDGVGGVTGLQEVVALALSPDGTHLYAASRDAGASAVSVFARDDDAGTLTHLESELDATQTGGEAIALARPTALTVSPDGLQVYVASSSGDAVQTFARDADDASPGFGLLAYRGLQQKPHDGAIGLGGANGLVLSPGGEHLYVLGGADNSVVLFDRGADGSLAQRPAATWTSGSGLPGLQGPSAIGITADGTEVFVTGLADHSLTIFRRDADGMLTARQTVFDEQGSVTTMAGPAALAVSPDDRNVYVAANLDNAIVVFLREAFTEVFGDGFDD